MSFSHRRPRRAQKSVTGEARNAENLWSPVDVIELSDPNPATIVVPSFQVSLAKHKSFGARSASRDVNYIQI